MPEKLNGRCLFSSTGCYAGFHPDLILEQCLYVSCVKKCYVNHFRTNNAHYYQRWICNFPYKCTAIDCNDFFPQELLCSVIILQDLIH